MESDPKNVNEVDEIAAAAAAEALGETSSAHASASATASDGGGQQSATEERIAALETALADAQQDVLYAKAETQNVRRRSEKEVADAHAYSATKFARDVLSVADNLSRALDAIPPAAREDDGWKALVTGLEATGRELSAIFERHGISRIETVGKALDPNQHQAMMEIPTSDAEPGTIVQEIQSGYMIKDRLLRPALVGVAKAV